MTKLLANGEIATVVPDGQDHLPEGKRAAYHLRAPSVHDRARFRRACRALGAAYPGDDALVVEARCGLAEILPDTSDPDRQAYEAVLERREEIEAAVRAVGGGAPVPADLDDDVARLAHLDTELARHWPPYARMVADRAFWIDVAPIEAARLFLIGWVNAGVDLGAGLHEVPGSSGVPDAVLAAFDPDHLAAIGARALGLFGPTGDEAKNSESPSPGGPEAPTSTAASTPDPTPPSAAGAATEA